MESKKCHLKKVFLSNRRREISRRVWAQAIESLYVFYQCHPMTIVGFPFLGKFLSLAPYLGG